MKILIIGGSGYIGSKLYGFLKSKKFNVDSVDLNWFGDFSNSVCLDMKDIDEMAISEYSHIILLAGHSSVKMCKKNPISVVKNNVLNFVSIIEKLNDDQIFMYASSSSVYGDTSQKEVSEDFINFKPNNCYDLSKYEIDSYASLSDKNYFALRFGTVNGSSPNFRNDIMINAMTFNGIKNNKVFCFNPETNRPILGILDLCRAFEKIILYGNKENKGVYNLASFNSNALEISQKVSKVLDVDLEIIDSEPNEITNVKLQTKSYDFLINSSKFENTFDFEFEDSVESIVQSIVEDYSLMKKGGRSDAKIY